MEPPLRPIMKNAPGDPPVTPPPALPPMPEMRWYERLNLLNATFVLFILAVIYSAHALEGPGRSLDYLANIRRFVDTFFPPDLSPALLAQVGSALLTTIEIAILATFFAIGISFVLALGAAQNISPSWLVWIIRMILNGIRTIPSLIWALLAVVIVGPNALAGVIALTFYSIGYLGKFFSEAFESVDLEVARGLRGNGADFIQAFQFGLWPHAKPLVWSYSIWMLEYNIRSAAIIGYVGAGGIGQLLHTFQEFSWWDRFSTVLLCIFILVASLDFLGERVRRYITRRLSPATLAD